MDQWRKKDLRYLWHPYTQMKDCRKLAPILIDRAKGVKLYDASGKFYYDTISSWWCNVHGHNHPSINLAIKKQISLLEHTLFAGFTHKPAIQLAEQLVRISPKNLVKVFFSDNGSTAVEAAIKMSFQYWQNSGNYGKTKFVSLDHAYHGDTIGAMSVGAVSLFNEKFKPLFFPSFKIPSPYCYRCPKKKERPDCDIDCIEPLAKLLKKRHREISAVIIEPIVLAAGGMIIYPKEYLSRLYRLTKKFGVHLIVDEVATGFGRTGKMFASQYAEGIQPDFMCLSKGITGGYLPLAATLVSQKIYNSFYADYQEKKTFYHGHTYTANPIACAAALASLAVFEKEKSLEKVKKTSTILKKRLKEMNSLPHVGDTRSIGTIAAIELVKDKKTKKPFDFRKRVGYKVYNEALKGNLILRPLGDVIYLFLPLNIEESDLLFILDKCHQLVRDIRL
jgi:adenosylmethionine---8-amino-7-oxononanoate aminotransferase